MSKYGMASRKMLHFLNENPGATARAITEHLFDNKSIEQWHIRYRNVWTHRANAKQPERSSIGSTCEFWFSKEYVLNSMLGSKHYTEVDIIGERVIPLAKLCRGKFAYLTSPYCSRTLAADSEGRRVHPGAANRHSQRKWFYRVKGSDGVFRYFLTLVGMAALPEHGTK